MRGKTMRRRLVVTYRANGFIAPAAQRLIELFVRSAAAPAGQAIS